MEFNLLLHCTFLQGMIPREMARFHASYGRTLESLKARMRPDKFVVLLMSLMASVQLRRCFGWQGGLLSCLDQQFPSLERVMRKQMIGTWGNLVQVQRLQWRNLSVVKVSHPSKIAVGGHSYGAFMASNLLAHAPPLFCCGIARSGAYNRTLTPFGFQNEDRTLWNATNTYVVMSPFMSANKIKKPLLLIHGEEDSNSGTLTMQSDRFFNALKGHGAPSRLVILSFESHGYAARQSIMHVLWETDRWLQKYCVSNTCSDENAGLGASTDDTSKGTTDSSEAKVVADAAAGDVALESEDLELDTSASCF